MNKFLQIGRFAFNVEHIVSIYFGTDGTVSIEWARSKVERIANQEQKDTLAYLFDKERFWRVRPQVVELSFYLAAR